MHPKIMHNFKVRKKSSLSLMSLTVRINFKSQINIVWVTGRLALSGLIRTLRKQSHTYAVRKFSLLCPAYPLIFRTANKPG